jgi:hypothetical protein
MIDAFVSVGASSFDITILDINGDEVKGQQRTRCSLTETHQAISQALANAERHQHNVIIRPRSAGTRLIQLDDLNAEKAARIAPHAFIEILTSPGNYQSWVAVNDIPGDDLEAARDFARRLKRGAGADHSATAAVRIAGSQNFKRKYAPDFPTVQIMRANVGKLVTMAQLEQAGLVAPREEEPLPPASAPPIVSTSAAADRRWPDWQRALAGAPPKSDGSGPDRSLADFMWSKWAIQRGWSIEETAARLIEVSEKAGKQARDGDEGYARVTAYNAAKAVERDRGRERSRSGSTIRREF